ncbi:MAG: hypothetical protein H6R05_106 [Burkholderiaceae bacterium]|nr:hypothetical protein [Burkholderiaceae bacterium]
MMRLFWMVCLATSLLTGCAVISVADAATSLAVGVVKTTVKIAGAVVDVAIPDEDTEENPAK